MAMNAVAQACQELEGVIASLANANPRLQSRGPFQTRFESRRSRHFRGNRKTYRGRVVIVDRSMRRVAVVEPIYIAWNAL